MKLKRGMKVKAKFAWHSFTLDFASRRKRDTGHGVEFRVVQLIKLARGTEYKSSDWVVAKPELAQDPKCWYGIGTEQIIEIVS